MLSDVGQYLMPPHAAPVRFLYKKETRRKERVFIKIIYLSVSVLLSCRRLLRRRFLGSVTSIFY